MIRNLSTIRHRPAFDKPADFRDSAHRAPDAGILEHERKRRVEVKCLELEVSLQDDGVSEADVETQVAALRRALLAQSEGGRERGSIKMHETHELGRAKEVANERMRAALGISKEHVEGRAFDKVAQAEDKVRKQEERVRADEERLQQAARRQVERERQDRERDELKRTRDADLERAKQRAVEISKQRRVDEQQRLDKERDEGMKQLDQQLDLGRKGKPVDGESAPVPSETDARTERKRSRSTSPASRTDARSPLRQRRRDDSPRGRSPSPVSRRRATSRSRSPARNDVKRGRSPSRSLSRSSFDLRSRSRSYSRSPSRSPRLNGRRDSPERRRESPRGARGSEKEPVLRRDSRSRSPRR